MPATSFTIDIPQHRIEWILRRLAEAHWPDVPAVPAWGLGTDPACLRELVTHWLGEYDWRKEEAALNRWPHFLADVEGQTLHFLHVRGSGANPRPVLLIHGWPGTFTEFLGVIERLAHPERFGGRAEDGMSLVIPSLPGFGFSGKPRTPIGPRAIAGLFDRLMTEVLGYDGYLAQGGDWGSSISYWLGREGRGCGAVHTNFIAGWGMTNMDPASELFQASRAKFFDIARSEGGYQSIQGTKPLTLSYALQDSPLGTAAWILEKFRSWSHLLDGQLWSVYDRDALITHLMVYLVTDTIGTSTWIYTLMGQDGSPLPGRFDKPLGVANFPGELFVLPRTYYESQFPILRWTDMEKGGHFAAMEQPALFAAELQAFMARIRSL
ncbi:MAG: epoxide hydrolase [Proteobacteria bacterium]|nr:epoxide hydrolase [Pseudomonadota bacterium]HQR03797.1 epoxide hydrolase [Rhodocyclaceae bacterium]